MPFYDYRCGSCGDFRELRPMAESGTAQVCPTCGTASERVISAPFLAGIDPNTIANRPEVGGGRTPWRAACGFGCSHLRCGA
jgi:putative FmdB family regulatory protein